MSAAQENGDSDAPNGEQNGEADSAEISLDDHQKLKLLWTIIQGDPKAELGRTTGIAQLCREVHGMVGVTLRTLRDQEVAIGDLEREVRAHRDLLQELLRRTPAPKLPDGVASKPPDE